MEGRLEVDGANCKKYALRLDRRKACVLDFYKDNGGNISMKKGFLFDRIRPLELEYHLFLLNNCGRLSFILVHRIYAMFPSPPAGYSL